MLDKGRRNLQQWLEGRRAVENNNDNNRSMRRCIPPRQSTNHHHDTSRRIRKRSSTLRLLEIAMIVSCWMVMSAEALSSSIRKQTPEDTSPTTPVIPQDAVVPQPPVVDHVATTPIATTKKEDNSNEAYQSQQPTPLPTGEQSQLQNSHPGTAPVVAPSTLPNVKRISPTTRLQQSSSSLLQEEDSSVLQEQGFLDWCAVAGIQTNLTIQMFEYHDYMKAHTRSKMGEGGGSFLFYQPDTDDDDYVPSSYDEDEFTTSMQVRGLAAMHDIAEGEVVISVPFTSMIAVPTTIDEDPILNRVMGPKARKLYEWDDDEFYELGLLSVALLYHRHLGKASPLSNYIAILETATTDHFPFLWPKDKLRKEATNGVRRHARAIAKDVNEVYETILGVLRNEFPVLFDTDIYSLDNFLWAFALVHSRLWHLPIPDLHQKQKKRQEEPENHAPQLGIGDQVPPASLPTEEWMQDQGDTDEDDLPVESHSFLAPVADLLNFGPPCTRGTYNTKARAFELVATCSFLKGQEVTYWYSDDCDDIVIANYGFTHPMVPACPTMDDLQHDIDKWKRRALNLETEIGHVYDDLDEMERELERAQSVLTSCNCDGFRIPKAKTMSSSKSRKTAPPDGDGTHDHIRGRSSTNQQKSDHERGRGIRHKAWNHQKSDQGL